MTGGKIRLELAPLDLAALTAQVVATWQSGGRFAHHDVQTDLAPVWIAADRARIEQVISNLLDNALKYTPAGGTIRLSVRAQGEEARLEVSATGEGMTPELIPRVFDLFVQGERDLARERGGLGIGLTMAKRLVELHGGTITATSAGAGKGATITVALRVIEQPAAPADVPPSVCGSVARCILIIEDNADARESLVALLRLTGHQVHAAENGAQGIDLAAAVAPELVLVDIGLPDIDGYEVARRLRASPATRRLRLVALTGYGTQEDRRRTQEAGFDDHLVKPVELEALEALMRPLAARSA